jgi:hypothetical protein
MDRAHAAEVTLAVRVVLDVIVDPTGCARVVHRLRHLNVKETERLAESGSLHDAFLDQLRGAYDAEKQLTRTLPRMAQAATSPAPRDASEAHLEQTGGHIERLDQEFEGLGGKVRAKRRPHRGGRSVRPSSSRAFSRRKRRPMKS